jgi:hypothetical protein
MSSWVISTIFMQTPQDSSSFYCTPGNMIMHGGVNLSVFSCLASHVLSIITDFQGMKGDISCDAFPSLVL